MAKKLAESTPSLSSFTATEGTMCDYKALTGIAVENRAKAESEPLKIPV